MKLSLAEVLVLATIVVMLAALLLPATRPPPPLTDEDLNFEGWDSGLEDAVLPLEGVVASDVIVAGEWLCSRRHTWLSIEPGPSGTWQITFRSSTRCGLGKSVLLSRTARYQHGVLTLNRPVQEVSGKTYQRFYTVRIYDREYFVPSVRLEKVQQVLESGTKEEQLDALDWEVLARLVQQ